MKNLPSVKTLLLALAALFPVLTHAGAASVPHMRLESAQVTNHGDEVRVTLTLDVPARDIRSNYTLLCTPVLTGPDCEIALTPISFTGSRKRLSDHRKRIINEIDPSALPERIEGRPGKTEYVLNIPYQRWMSAAPLTMSIDRAREGYTRTIDLGRLEISKDIRLSHPWPIYTPILEVPDTTDASPRDRALARAIVFANDGRYDRAVLTLAPYYDDEPMAAMSGICRIAADDSLRTRLFPLMGLKADGSRYAVGLDAVSALESLPTDTLSAKVLFRVKKTDIDTAHADNARTLEQIGQSVLTSLKYLRQGSAPTITITGTASPEGYNIPNRRLAGQRAEALKEYLVQKLNVPDSLIRVVNAGPDWKGLRALVEASDMEYHAEVLRVLDNTPENERAHALWKLKWGHPYKYIYENFFPLLRGSALVTISPGTKTADTVNRAIGLIAAGQYGQALSLLETVAHDPSAAPALEICRAITYEKTE